MRKKEERLTKEEIEDYNEILKYMQKSTGEEEQLFPQDAMNNTAYNVKILQEEAERTRIFGNKKVIKLVDDRKAR